MSADRYKNTFFTVNTFVFRFSLSFFEPGLASKAALCYRTNVPRDRRGR